MTEDDKTTINQFVDQLLAKTLMLGIDETLCAKYVDFGNITVTTA